MPLPVQTIHPNHSILTGEAQAKIPIRLRLKFGSFQGPSRPPELLSPKKHHCGKRSIMMRSGCQRRYILRSQVYPSAAALMNGLRCSEALYQDRACAEAQDMYLIRVLKRLTSSHNESRLRSTSLREAAAMSCQCHC